jgi:hypothetical protein
MYWSYTVYVLNMYWISCELGGSTVTYGSLFTSITYTFELVMCADLDLTTGRPAR